MTRVEIDGELKTTTFIVRPDQIVMVDRVKALLQQVTPGRSISRSDVVRAVFDQLLPELAEKPAAEVKEILQGVAA